MRFFRAINADESFSSKYFLASGPSTAHAADVQSGENGREDEVPDVSLDDARIV